MHDAFHFHSLVWDWPIAVYLLLVGISSGMMTLTLLFRRYVPQEYHHANPLVVATAIVAPLSVMLGLLILIFHLARPLTFWYLLLFYNPTSIMSLGVMLFQVYLLVMLLWLFALYRQPLLGWCENRLSARLHQKFASLLNVLVRRIRLLENLLLALALLLGCYTGFLLSALKSFPLLNNPLLPVLFLVSGVTSGIAVMLLVASSSRWRDACPQTLHFLHQLEKPVAIIELCLLFAFFIGLLLGGGQKTVAAQAALSGFWGAVFWLGILGAGILVPMAAGAVPAWRHAGGRLTLTTATLSLLGVFLLRLFVLYAGQMTVA
ncbi:cytochrome c nitrite reductase subunit NrfD [Dickeya fangzhongdai]|uniref:cytochrome c nitrite reductase subunit NrfD n=1 Tax=Dickeya fangzhongdai TaxID=1778540 RepID=UPI0004F7051F|nr:cytochrome c nitrite reductase subunit NrfD [Dickeya fangzhongdai]AIR69127.1 nitrite reductase [Dickeya fangzhongdai]KGT98596.1 nitrite reductase [Dickeya fangzhongdai]KHN58960.1 nitrite reductase [Dickeya fangzhongdai]WPD77345.1 cytochrome c nitrite reductase subunit NrfD [Dickeya fangzhongdai]